jgi:TolB-like protein/class 3 adenylate cyclase
LRRKLATILVADIAGYSRLMGEDEARTFAEFKRLLKNAIKPAIRRRKGRIIKMLGDGFLAEFDSPVNAVNCALAIQSASGRRSKAVPADQQIHFRIGINLGDIIVENGDIAGDAVNIAARLQALADPGSILVSDSVFQHVKGKVEAGLEDMGPQSLKNIAQAVRAYRTRPNVDISVARRALQEFERPVIAVLPFSNFSGEASQQYFTDGMTEDLITELSRFRMVSVIARNSSFVYRDKAADVRRVGQDLNAQFVVEGSVRQLDQSMRITVQLVHAETRRHIWAEHYDAQMDNLFSVQDDVTRRIVATLIPRIESDELEKSRRHPTGHMRAYDCYLRGMAEYHAARDGAGIERARRHFEEAIRMDPDFARAYVQLARIENVMTTYAAAGTPLGPLRQRAWELTLRAASLDDSDPATHLSLAWGHLYRSEFEAAQRHLDIATQLNPNDAELAVDRGTTLMCLGDPNSAIELIKAGIRLNPFHTDSCLADLAEAYYVARRYDEAIKIAEQIADPWPRFAGWRAAAYAMAGRQVEAKQHVEAFERKVREIWAGDPNAGPAEYISWLLSWSPFRRQEDIDHLVTGLERAGLTRDSREG